MESVKLHQQREVTEEQAVQLLFDLGKLSANDLRQLDLCLNGRRRWTYYLERKAALIQFVLAPASPILH